MSKRNEMREALEFGREYAKEALVDLGACDNPYCTDCPRVLPRVREAIREHAAGTEPAGRIR